MIPTFFGIDGCKAGWLAIWTQGGSYCFSVKPSLNILKKDHPSATRYLIDIPIGLPSTNHPRTLDTVMRRELPGRSSTVFPVVARAALQGSTGAESSQLNFFETGKKLSKQSQAIIPKIREADRFFEMHPSVDLIESHPEIAFKHLNGGTVLQSRKKSKYGLEERLNILSIYNRKAERIYHKILSATLRKDVAYDDILDALCLAITLEMAKNNLLHLRDNNTEDSLGRPIQIGYFAAP